MMSLKYKEISRMKINDNFDALHYSKLFNNILRRSKYYFFFIPSKVVRVGRNFSITERLNITIASVDKLRGMGIVKDSDIKTVYEGSLIHENMHALGFPIITRAREVLSPVVKYLSERGISIDEELFNMVENVISDVINEIMAITKKIDEHGKLVTARYLYQVKNQENKNIPLIEKSPSLSLLKKHNDVFRDRYMNRKPDFGDSKTDMIYQMITHYSESLNMKEHTHLVNIGGFSKIVIRSLLEGFNLYSVMDRFFEWYTSVDRVDRTSAIKILSIFENIPEELRLYALYYSLLSTFYRIETSIPENPLLSLSGEGTVMDKIKLPIPSDEESEGILNKITGDSSIKPSEMDKITDNLIKEVITVNKPSSVIKKSKVMEVTIPFYMNPRGRIDPLSVVKSRRGVLDWEVYDEIEYASMERGYSKSSPPDHFTALIDISGSTMYPSAVLLPLAGTETSTLDVERAIVISMMKIMKRKGLGKIKATIFLFEENIRKNEGSIDEMIEFLLDKQGKINPTGGTKIVKALKEGLKTHKDKRDNPFIIVTDLEISRREEEIMYNLITRKLKLSPLLIVIIGGKTPEILSRLNIKKNAAVVSIRTIGELPKLEEAIRKVSTRI